MSEGRAVNVTVHPAIGIELGMIESIKGLEAEFQRLGFTDPRGLVQGDIEILDARAVEEPA